MRSALRFLAGRRWAGVGLALVVELLLLVALSLVPPSASIGLPAAVAAAVAGTVAVVFGVVDGVAVATIGAIAFAWLGGWSPGEVATIAAWPSVVAAAGLFARRVERHRVILRRLVDAQEDERRALALTLHDDSAQTLTGALLALRALSESDDARPTSQARELIADTIQQLRRIALELSPRALEDFGLAVALEHLADSDAAVAFDRAWDGRLPAEAERTLFRFAQAAVAAANDRGATSIAVRLARERDRVLVAVSGRCSSAPALPAALEERVRLIGGHVDVSASAGAFALRADVPAQRRLLEPAERVA